jgi:hypothetical protein
MIEAPWVSPSATVAGRWRARRLNSTCGSLTCSSEAGDPATSMPSDGVESPSAKSQGSACHGCERAGERAAHAPVRQPLLVLFGFSRFTWPDGRQIWPAAAHVGGRMILSKQNRLEVRISVKTASPRSGRSQQGVRLYLGRGELLSASGVQVTAARRRCRHHHRRRRLLLRKFVAADGRGRRRAGPAVRRERGARVHGYRRLLSRRAHNGLGTATQCTRMNDSPPPPPPPAPAGSAPSPGAAAHEGAVGGQEPAAWAAGAAPSTPIDAPCTPWLRHGDPVHAPE